MKTTATLVILIRLSSPSWRAPGRDRARASPRRTPQPNRPSRRWRPRRRSNRLRPRSRPRNRPASGTQRDEPRRAGWRNRRRNRWRICPRTRRQNRPLAGAEPDPRAFGNRDATSRSGGADRGDDRRRVARRIAPRRRGATLVDADRRRGGGLLRPGLGQRGVDPAIPGLTSTADASGASYILSGAVTVTVTAGAAWSGGCRASENAGTAAAVTITGGRLEWRLAGTAAWTPFTTAGLDHACFPRPEVGTRTYVYDLRLRVEATEPPGTFRRSPVRSHAVSRPVRGGAMPVAARPSSTLAPFRAAPGDDVRRLDRSTQPPGKEDHMSRRAHNGHIELSALAVLALLAALTVAPAASAQTSGDVIVSATVGTSLAPLTLTICDGNVNFGTNLDANGTASDSNTPTNILDALQGNPASDEGAFYKWTPWDRLAHLGQRRRRWPGQLCATESPTGVGSQFALDTTSTCPSRSSVYTNYFRPVNLPGHQLGLVQGLRHGLGRLDEHRRHRRRRGHHHPRLQLFPPGRPQRDHRHLQLDHDLVGHRLAPVGIACPAS